MLPKIGIIGIGFVGRAVKASLEVIADIAIVDSNPALNEHTYDDLMECEAIFVCVPSPQGEDGVCDASILQDVLAKLKGYTGTIISKTTAPPGVYKELGYLYPNLVHVPEFLTAANAKRDYLNGTFAIIGGTVRAYMNEAERFVTLTQPNTVNDIFFCSLEEASLAKYAINTFLATKVVFMNELHKLAEAVGADFDHVATAMTKDPRIGKSHHRVPGTDGFGFSGMCFPKDAAALLQHAKVYGIDMTVLDTAVRTNKVLRNEV